MRSIPVSAADPAPLLAVEGLKVHFHTRDGVVRAVDGVDFQVAAGQTLCIVGESGSGKTVSSLTLLRLAPPPAKIVAGRVMFEGEDLLTQSDKRLAEIRGRRMAMIFQNPATSLNPVLSIGSQLTEILRWHTGASAKAARERAAELLALVGISDPVARLRQYPHELSGGMKQRVGIARALLCEPSLLLADEPTTALDVTIQAQILDLLADLRQRLGMAMVLVTHDMGVVARMADRITVMYAGRVCETADAVTIFIGAGRQALVDDRVENGAIDRRRPAARGGVGLGSPSGRSGGDHQGHHGKPAAFRVKRRPRQHFPTWSHAQGKTATAFCIQSR